MYHAGNIGHVSFILAYNLPSDTMHYLAVMIHHVYAVIEAMPYHRTEVW
ncbi:hypothetical protein LCGC14_1102930 [marine sediment metagenome]|uniref:Uncharacterized protein n=1 Tax=marine sediment metagenome TaxID=412755 RepID=A0A0F9MDI0_9ZZZZ